MAKNEIPKFDEKMLKVVTKNKEILNEIDAKLPKIQEDLISNTNSLKILNNELNNKTTIANAMGNLKGNEELKALSDRIKNINKTIEGLNKEVEKNLSQQFESQTLIKENEYEMKKIHFLDLNLALWELRRDTYLNKTDNYKNIGEINRLLSKRGAYKSFIINPKFLRNIDTFKK